MKTLRLFVILTMYFLHIETNAQIGYQVSLLNSATGEPRRTETINVTVSITNNKGEVIHTETQIATTNDFGVLALTVGNNNTFTNVDWSKLPFYIAVSANDKFIGKSQILSVPLAEYAKNSGVLTKEILCSKTWQHKNSKGDWISTSNYSFNLKGTGVKLNDDEMENFTYIIDGNHVVALFGNEESINFKYYPPINAIIDLYGGFVYK